MAPAAKHMHAQDGICAGLLTGPVSVHVLSTYLLKFSPTTHTLGKLPVYAYSYLVEMKVQITGPPARYGWRLEGLVSQPELNGKEVEIVRCPENDKVMESRPLDPMVSP